MDRRIFPIPSNVSVSHSFLESAWEAPPYPPLFVTAAHPLIYLPVSFEDPGPQGIEPGTAMEQVGIEDFFDRKGCQLVDDPELEPILHRALLDPPQAHLADNPGIKGSVVCREGAGEGGMNSRQFVSRSETN